MKYSNIRNIGDLDAERRKLSGKIDRKGREVMARLEYARDSYSPAGIIACGLKNISSSFLTDKFLLTLIRFLRKRL